jgi:isoquinoline 1-oxidoreductase subunit alpha
MSAGGAYGRRMKLRVNGTLRDLDVPADTPLLWALRDELGLTGTKFGCGMAQCGACTVHLDGQPRRACVTPVSTVGERHVTTIEGLGGGAAGRDGDAGTHLHVVQRAWQEADVVQCGYCQSGQIMTAAALIDAVPDPSDADIDAAMAGNVCRCGTYERMRAAVHLAAKMKREGT